MISLARKIKPILIAIGLFAHFLYAQESQEFTQALEWLLENTEEEQVNFETHLENLAILYDHPLNINKTTTAELAATGLFTNIQTNALLDHIDQYGKLLSVYELQVIPEFTLEFIQVILPYISTASHLDDYHVRFKSLISKGKNQIFFRYQQSFPNKSGFTNNNYIGHPSKLFLRYRYNYDNNLFYGFTAEKDQSEPMFRDKNKLGFDFYSFHFFWRKSEKFSAIALGDYQINLGQGLVLWTGFGFNKSTEQHLNKKEGSTLRPFTSLNEYLFLRGFAMTYHRKNWEMTPFLSYKKVAANISYVDSLNNDLETNRVQINGYHRTAQELENKNAIQELKTGTNIQYKTRKWHLGFNFLFTHFSKEIRFDKKTYNRFQFQGKTLVNTSIDYHYLLKSFHFFGENAISIANNKLGLAALNGVIFTPNKKIDYSIIHRYYQREYQTHYYTNSFGERSTPNGENGIYMGTQLRLSKPITISAYFDYYLLNWLQFRTDKPSSGYDFTSQFKHKISKRFEWYLNFKREEKEGNTKIQLGTNEQLSINSSNRPFIEAYFGNLENPSSLKPNGNISKQAIESATLITPILLHRLRLNCTFKANKSWTFQTRIEYSFYHDKINPSQRGYLLFQDVKFNSINSPFGFSSRIAIFDIPQFNSRIYAYENDVLYQFSIPAMFNAGMRYYLNLNYQVSTWMDVWLRFATTYYSDISSKGSGNEEILSNKNYDIKMQIRWKF